MNHCPLHVCQKIIFCTFPCSFFLCLFPFITHIHFPPPYYSPLSLVNQIITALNHAMTEKAHTTFLSACLPQTVFTETDNIQKYFSE